MFSVSSLLGVIAYCICRRFSGLVSHRLILNPSENAELGRSEISEREAGHVFVYKNNGGADCHKAS